MGSFLELDTGGGGGGEVSTGGQEGWAEVGRFTFRKEETGVCGSQSRGGGRYRQEGGLCRGRERLGAGIRAEEIGRYRFRWVAVGGGGVT